MRRALRYCVIFAVMMTASITPPLVPSAETGPVLPAGFEDELVANLFQPTAIAFTPDGRMLVTVEPGRLHVILPDGTLLPTPALSLGDRTCGNVERGLLGVAVDPAFTVNHFIYVFYTFRRDGVECPIGNATLYPNNRVSRFVLPDTNIVKKNNETVLVDGIVSKTGNHNAGDLNFGKDGFLYVTTGDGGQPNRVRERNNLNGKILRITRDGDAPASNPFTGVGTAPCRLSGTAPGGAPCRETFSWGLRNPFRFAFDPNVPQSRFFIGDVGQNTWEEIDLGTAGADYGWNVREGPCAMGSTTDCGPPPEGMTNPIFSYDHSDGCSSVTGSAVVPEGVWPEGYESDLLFSDFVCGKIFRLKPNPNGPGFVRTTFASGLGNSSAVHLRFGPWGPSKALYYTTYADGGQVRRIVYRPGNGRPTASIAASPTFGPSPLMVTFDGSGSTDPEDEALTYLWDFGDGVTDETSSPSTTHTYAQGTYTASLVVRDARDAQSDPETVLISVDNGPPVPTITSPAEGARFAAGQQITLTGGAIDAEDGAVQPSGLSWRVLLHHNTHTHPYFGPVTGNNLTFTAPAPEDLIAAQNSYLEIYLTATDGDGASTTLLRAMQPRLVNITLKSEPSGMLLRVNSTDIIATTTIVSWEGYALDLNAVSPQNGYRFVYWSDGGTRRHTVITPATSKGYKANYITL